MHDDDVIATREQLLHQCAADEKRSADHECACHELLL
jgi:hypothetical protein